MKRSTATILSIFAVFTLFIFSFTFSDRHPYPTDYFGAPVGGTLRLSGTFGELRANHFHGGIDIKGGIGVPLYAAGDGYISRIKVEGGGYGNALYIDHPNGYTSVYGHMNSFAPHLDAYVKSQQYAREQFSVDLYPDKDLFTVTKGDKIGEMGTTGYSFGPHLHFEMRHSDTGATINPLLFGIKVEDDRQPRMHQLKVYELNDQLETREARTHSLVSKNGGYGLSRDTLYLASGLAGFGIKVYDHMNGVSNWNGIYTLEAFLDDSLIYNFKMETIPFEETRYLNAHLDYVEQRTNGAYINRCYRLPGNQLSIYGRQNNDGVVSLSREKAKKVELVASDVAGNQSHFTFWVKRKKEVTGEEEKKPYNYFLPYDQESLIDNGSMQVYLPKGTLYENCYLQYHLTTDRSHNVFSSVHQLHDPATPVHLYYDLAIRPVVLPESLRDKAFIALCTSNSDIVNYGGAWDNGMLRTQVRTFGDFCIMVDETPPSIRAENFPPDLRGAKRIDFIIWDNYRTSGKAKGLDFRATIDGNWVLMNYDLKNSRLTHYFDEALSPGKHQFRLVVTDALNNEKSFERSFIR